MSRLLSDLNGGVVRPDGSLVDRDGQATGLRVIPGGYIIIDITGHAVGTLTMVGRIYNSAGHLVAQVERHDMLPEAGRDRPLRPLVA